MEIVETESDRMGKTVTKTKRRKYIPPSVTAQIFILKNRRGDWWRDKQVIEQQSDGQLAALIDGLKDDKAEGSE